MSLSLKWNWAATATVHARYPQVTTDHSTSNGRGSDQTATLGREVLRGLNTARRE